MRTARVGGAILTLGLGMFCAARSPAADNAATPERLVRQALQAELHGADADRRGLLAAALALDPDYAPARWQSGYVRIGDDWVSVDEAPRRFSADTQLAAYRQKRDAMVDTADNQRELARWCHRNRLPDEERIHWAKVLGYEPQNAEAMKALGLKWHERGG
jgi:hypothetical protein